MGDEGGAMPTGLGAPDGHVAHNGDLPAMLQPIQIGARPMDEADSPMSPRTWAPNPFSRQHSTLDLDDYFASPHARLLNRTC
jgi:hypothetical protein